MQRILGTRAQESAKHPQFLWLLHYGTTSPKELTRTGHAGRRHCTTDRKMAITVYFIYSKEPCYSLMRTLYGLKAMGDGHNIARLQI